MPRFEAMAAGLCAQVIREQWALLKALENLQAEHKAPPPRDGAEAGE
jgi:hypothetical protein